LFGKDKEKKAQEEEAKKQADSDRSKAQVEKLFKETEQERLKKIAILEKKIREDVTNY
jgi:hypothetical protein